MTDEERRAKQRQYYAENRERINKWKREHRAEITERSRATRAAYYNANRETINAKQRERYYRHKVEIWNSLKKGNENGTRAGT